MLQLPDGSFFLRKRYIRQGDIVARVMMRQWLKKRCLYHERKYVRGELGSVWQGSGSSKNGFGSGYFGGVAFLMELKSFWKTFGKTASPLGLRL
jgi:hypothetical protein